jgi:hypothetical protein
VLAALGIGWQTGRPHITCQYPRHADDNPSWRWELREAQVFGICIEKSASAFDATMSRTILDLYCNSLTSSGLKKKSGKLKQRDDLMIRLPVTYIGQDPHYRVEPLRRQITEQECPADKPKPARRGPGRPRRVV